MWSVVKSCRFHHPITCQSCLHFSLSTSIPQTLSSLHFSWSPDNRRTSPLVHIHPLHPQDPAIFSRGKSDLVTAAAQFSVQSPYVGFHCSVVKVHNSHGGLQQHLPFWPHPYATVPLCSVTQSGLTLCDPVNCSTPGLPVHHQFLEFTQTISIESVMPSNHLILYHPLLLPSIFPNIRVFSNGSALCIWWPKYWSFCFNMSPSKEHPGLISFRMDWLDLLPVHRTLKSLLQHHSTKASILWHSAFFTVQLSHPYMTTGKTIALNRQTFVGKVMSLLLNMLSRLVVTFLPRSKRLLISWLQLPSAVILEPPKNEVSHCFPIYLPWSDGTRCHDLRFLNVEL